MTVRGISTRVTRAFLVLALVLGSTVMAAAPARAQLVEVTTALDVADTNYRARHVYDKIGFTPIGQHLGPQNLVYVDMAIARAEYERRYKTPHYSRRGRRLSG